jgi:hypothetical protein
LGGQGRETQAEKKLCHAKKFEKPASEAKGPDLHEETGTISPENLGRFCIVWTLVQRGILMTNRVLAEEQLILGCIKKIYHSADTIGFSLEIRLWKSWP